MMAFDPFPRFRHLTLALALALGLSSLHMGTAHAKKLGFIRDAEIETTIRIYATPLLRTAGLEPSAVHIHLIQDNSLNAFVAGGQRLFFHTGLLMKSAHPGQLIGVIAHEIGHISGGHLSRTNRAMKDASAANIVAMVLGGLVAAGSGRGDVGMAIMLGGPQAGLRNFLRYSQTQEASADHAGLKFLDQVGWSSEGSLEFLRMLGKQDLLSPDRQDPYMRTHPVTRDRIHTIEEHVRTSPYAGAAFPPEFTEMHRRMRAKLFAFIQPPEVTLRRYTEASKDIEARYARAIAFYRRLDLEKALPLIDVLIAERPGDAFFHELKGQVLFEKGFLAQSLPSYQTAVDLMPTSALLRADLAKVQIETNDPALLDAAIENLKASLTSDSKVPINWRQIAIAYGRKGDAAMSALALAEEALLQGKSDIARYQAGKAETLLPRGSRGWLQAQDILAAARKSDKK